MGICRNDHSTSAWIGDFNLEFVRQCSNLPRDQGPCCESIQSVNRAQSPDAVKTKTKSFTFIGTNIALVYTRYLPLSSPQRQVTQVRHAGFLQRGCLAPDHIAANKCLAPVAVGPFHHFYD